MRSYSPNGKPSTEPEPEMKTAAVTYVQISREQLEDWLDRNYRSSGWSRAGTTAGVYLIHLSPAVAVKLSSSIGTADLAMSVGAASMQLSLVSRINGKTLNKKAQDRSHFKRTKGWERTWAEGVATMKDAYQGAADFYDALAAIDNRETYRDDLLARIQEVPGWNSDHMLTRMYRKVDGGGILTVRDLEDLEEREKTSVSPAKAPAPGQPDEYRAEALQDAPASAPPPAAKDPPQVVAARFLWSAARRKNDEWTMNFVASVARDVLKAGRRLSIAQRDTLVKKLDQYGVEFEGVPASALF